MDKSRRDEIALELLPTLLESCEYGDEMASVEQAFDLAELFLARAAGGQCVHAAEVLPGTYVYDPDSGDWLQVLETTIDPESPEVRINVVNGHFDLMRTDPCIVWFEGLNATTSEMVDAWEGQGESVPD